MHRKLRFATLAGLGLLVSTTALLPQAAFAAKPHTTESIAVTSLPVSTQLVATAGVGGTLQIPTLAPAPDGSDTEWLVVSGGRQDLVSITPTGTQKMVHLSAFQADNGAPDTYASVDAGGFDWVLDNDQGAPEDNLYAVGAASSESPGVNPVATFNGYAEDMTLGADGALYITDNAGNIIRCQITTVPSATCSTTPLNGAFDGGGYGIAGGSGLVWFTDATGELGTIDGSGNVTGPYADLGTGIGALSIDPGTLVGSPNTAVYAAGGAEASSTGNNEILAGVSTAPASVHVVASGLTNVVAMTTGPDGNIWFLDAGADGGAGAVGTMNIVTNAVTEYPLPSGMVIPSGARIVTGPNVADANGYGQVFFSATSAVPAGDERTGNALVGEVTGIPMPIVPGSIALQPSVTVSKQRLAVLTLPCAGAGNAECVGKLKLTVVAKYKLDTTVKLKVPYSVKISVRTKIPVSTKVRVRTKIRVKTRVKGKTKIETRFKTRIRFETRIRLVTRTRSETRTRLEARNKVQNKTARLSLGSVSYNLRGNSTLRAKMKLSKSAYRVLGEVSGHKWSATVAVTPTLGAVTGTATTPTPGTVTGGTAPTSTTPTVTATTPTSTSGTVAAYALTMSLPAPPKAKPKP